MAIFLITHPSGDPPNIAALVIAGSENPNQKKKAIPYAFQSEGKLVIKRLVAGAIKRDKTTEVKTVIKS